MLHSIQHLMGFTMGATDGEIGKIKDVYFDDKTWKVRYLVVETGNWLFGRKVLLSPVALKSPDLKSDVLPVNLTKDQIKHSPDINTDMPVSKQQEADLHSHYSWPMDTGAGVGFMTTGMVGGVVAPGVPFEERISEEVNKHEDETMSHREPEGDELSSGDPNLRSFKDLIGHTVHAGSEDLGEVHDFLVNTDLWTVPAMVIETGNWYSGKKVVCSTGNIGRIEWSDAAVHINQSTDYLKNNPEFDSDQEIDQELERKLLAIR